MAGGIHAVTAGQAIGYGWFGKGMFVKPIGNTMHKLRCARPENSRAVRLELDQVEKLSILARDQVKNPGLRDLVLDDKLSTLMCHVVVDVQNGAMGMPAGGATIKYALVAE